MSDQRKPKMRLSRLMFLALGMLVIGSVIAGGSLMGVELNKRNVSLVNTENELSLTQYELSAQENRNAELTLVNRDLNTDLADAEARNADLNAVNDGLTTDLANAESRNADLTDTNAGLTTDLAYAESRNANLTNANTGLTTDLADAESRNADLNAVNDGLTADLTDTRSQLAQSRKDYATLESVAGNVDRLRTQASNLEEAKNELLAEIAELRLERAPLVLKTHDIGFHCTGSMEPKLTCLDSATWLDNFRPEDIVVGTIISFETVEECSISGKRIGHRVMDIKHEDGRYYFWPQGDANDEPDGCWIPEENVNSYIIDVQKDVYPGNADLRNEVNSSRSNLKAADAARETAWETYATTFTSWCGFEPGTGRTCRVSNYRVSEINRLYDVYFRAHDAYKRAFEHYQCRQDRLDKAVWFGDGWLALHYCPPVITIPE